VPGRIETEQSLQSVLGELAVLIRNCQIRFLKTEMLQLLKNRLHACLEQEKLLSQEVGPVVQEFGVDLIEVSGREFFRIENVVSEQRYPSALKDPLL
jgi:hypothetical protein